MTADTSAAIRPKAIDVELSPAHYLQLIVHRKWLVIGIVLVVTAITAVIAQMLPNIYTSETLILVDPQRVPESYVKPTVTGDVRNRLGTLTQQILSATRLQKIIEANGLYQEERKKLAREDVIGNMRKAVNVTMVAGSGAQHDLEAFRVQYSGKDPRLVAQVTNQLAALFIEENLKAREQQATGTTEFLQHQLDETRKTLETQETKLRDFRMKHLGEMPEHQIASLTVLGQLQAALQQEGEALSRAEQQRSYTQMMMAQSTPVVDVDSGNDDNETKSTTPAAGKPSAVRSAAPVSKLAEEKAKLVALLQRYKEDHPAVRKLQSEIADLEAKERRTDTPPAPETATAAAPAEPPVPAPPARKRTVMVPLNSANPVLLSQLKTIEAEIAKHQAEQQRLKRLVETYQARLEAIPMREQQIVELVRDYEINKGHYMQLLDKQLAAETATQLEIRQKSERFSILDPAQSAQRPSSPNRQLIDIGGGLGGLILGVLCAIGTEFFGMSITCAEQIPLQHGNQVLEVIPLIMTAASRKRKKKQTIMAAISCAAASLAAGGFLFYYYHR